MVAFSHLTGETMGTMWSVKTLPVEGAADAESAIQSILDTVDAQMSTWRADSELSLVRAGEGPVPVSAETASVVQAALNLAQETGGAYDPTVQPLMEMWGFHGDAPMRWPSDADISAAKAQMGFEKVKVSLGENPTVDAGGTALDLSSIAKGFSVDWVSNALSGRGSTDYMVEVGGEVRVAGHNERGEPWAIGVDRVDGGEGFAAILSVTNVAVATSGNYRNKRLIDGREVGHTMDPRTGQPADTDVLSATVVAPDCQTADGWATALMVLGVEAIPMINHLPDTEALLLMGDRAAPTVVMSDGMDRHIRR